MVPFKRVCEVLNYFFEIRVSPGWIKLATDHELASSFFDETFIRLNGKTAFIHVATNGTDTILTPSKNRGFAGMCEGSILPYYNGTAVHDCFQAYFKFGQAKHSVCGVHLIRDLNFIIDFEKDDWAAEMKTVFQGCAQLKSLGRMKGAPKRDLRVQFREILRRQKSKYGWRRKFPRACKTHGRRFLKRLLRLRPEVERALFDPNIDFSNNAAERALRMIKVQQKVSGSFRSFGGLKQFCVLATSTHPI